MPSTDTPGPPKSSGARQPRFTNSNSPGRSPRDRRHSPDRSVAEKVPYTCPGHQGEATRILTEWELASLFDGKSAMEAVTEERCQDFLRRIAPLIVPGVPSNLAIWGRVGLRAYPLPSRR